MYEGEKYVAGDELGRNWWVLLLLGIIALVAGVFAIIWPFVSGLAFTAVFGVLLLIGAVVHLVHTVRTRHTAWSIILGLIGSMLYAGAGIVLLAYPVRGLLITTIVLGVTFAMQGIIQTAESLERIGRAGWGWMLVGALLTLVLGIWILAALPYSLTWALGLVVGVNLIFVGFALMAESAFLHRPVATQMAM